MWRGIRGADGLVNRENLKTLQSMIEKVLSGKINSIEVSIGNDDPVILRDREAVVYCAGVVAVIDLVING